MTLKANKIISLYQERDEFDEQQKGRTIFSADATRDSDTVRILAITKDGLTSAEATEIGFILDELAAFATPPLHPTTGTIDLRDKD